MRNVLILAAHPDDEVLGCGGTLLALHAKDRITLVVFTDGETSGNPPAHALPAKARQRRTMVEKAARMLGIAKVIFLGFPDQELDAVPLVQLLRRLEPVAQAVRPRIVYTHSQADINRDHRIAGQAALTLFRPLPRSPVREMYAFQAPPLQWGVGPVGRAFHPTLFVDISKTLSRKLRAFALYRSEVRPAPHPRSLRMIQAASIATGGLCGVTAAEAFETVRIHR